MFLIILQLLALSKSKLYVKSPKVVADLFHYQNQTGYMPFERANFGHYPYGQSLTGELVIPNDTYGCGPLQFRHTTYPSFVLVQRGQCHYVKKAKNIQNAGGQLMIVVSNLSEVSDEYVMANDGNGYQIKIPSISIGKINGDQLIQYMLSPNPEPIVIHAKFNVQQKDKIDIDIAIDLNQRISFSLIRQIGFSLRTMMHEGKAQVNIYYWIYKCLQCEAANYTQEIEDCILNGRYCLKRPEEHEKDASKNSIQEILRQSCLFQLKPYQFQVYLSNFDTFCFRPSEYEHCHKYILTKINKEDQEISNQIQQCVADSYVNNTNTILDNNLHFKWNSGLHGYPGVLLNGIPYYGNLEGEYVIESVCQTIDFQSEGCKQFPQYKTKEANAQKSSSWFLLIIIFILVTFFVGMIITYRVIIRRDVQHQNERVTQLVEQYVDLYEDRAKSRRQEQ